MNIILQHWTGPMQELHLRSQESMARYATFLGADYRRLSGNVFRERLLPQCQKVYMLNEEFDDYDIVVMVDMDCFARKGCEDSVFEEEGVGRAHVGHKRVLAAYPKLASRRHPFWGGAIYKMDRTTRQTLRSHITERDLDAFNSSTGGHDEGIMHRLATLANMPVTGAYMKNDKWCYSSFLPGPETAGIIHVRTKVTPQGPKRAKMENYLSLVEKGVL